MSSKIFPPALSRRRSIIAAITGLAAAAGGGNYAGAQHAADDDVALPDAADALTQMAPRAAPNLRFADAAGRQLRLADFQGSGLLVNLWATWCGPCVAEFPTLAAIAPRLAAAKILVLPISIDFEGLKVVRPFYAANGVRDLPILLDPDGSATDALNAPGIPVTIIVNPAGQLVGRMDGSANWNTARSLRLITRLAGQVAPAPSGFQPV